MFATSAGVHTRAGGHRLVKERLHIGVVSTAAPPPAQPLFSYVVATLNCAPLLDALADTARHLQGSPVEVCVSDGGSVDGTAQALQRMPGIRLVCSAPDAGVFDAWNRALPFVRGQYVGFLGVDDVPGLPFIHAAAQALLAQGLEGGTPNPATADKAGPALIYGDMVMHRRGRVRRYPAPQPLRLLAPIDAVFDLHHPGCLTRRDLFDGANSFDARYRLAGDFDFFLRMAPRIRAAGALRLEEVQAQVMDDGMSRQPGNVALCAQEHAHIAQRLGLRLGYRHSVFPALVWLARRPRVFAWCKDLSWALRGRRP